MATTLKDLLSAVNIFGEDINIYVDGHGTMAICPPVRLTPKGYKHFAQALTANVVVEYIDDEHEQTYISDPDHKITEKAYKMLTALAGYCFNDDYDIWFEGPDAQII